MQLIPLKTQRIVKGDDLVSALLDAKKSDPEVAVSVGDIIVISSKAVATAEGRIVELQKVHVSKEAENLAKQCGRSSAFCQAVLDEVEFRNGRVLGTCPGLSREAPEGAKWGAILTELRPRGLPSGTILTASAGLDESNIEAGFAVGWPEDPVASVRRIREQLEVHMGGNRGKRSEQGYRRTRRTSSHTSKTSIPSLPSLAIILSDSCCLPRRRGVIALALAVSGIDPVRNNIGVKDLFGKPLRITSEAIADQLATAANFIMGNAAQCIPAVIIRDHGLPMSNFEGWVPGIEPEEDLFRKLL